jgi:hypothetical protein
MKSSQSSRLTEILYEHGGGVKIHSMEGNFRRQRGLERIWKNPELQTMQVIKMATHTLIEKTAFKQLCVNW